jgi:hypothetical protein
VRARPRRRVLSVCAGAVVVLVVTMLNVGGPSSSTLVPTAAAQHLYTWTDENGVVHYTADPWSIPPKYRPAGLPTQPPAPPPRPAETPSIVGSRVATVVQFTPGDPILVTARLNGVPLTLLLDTGADRTLVSPAAVARAGYERTIVFGGSSVRIVGVTGSVIAPQVTAVLDVAGTRIGPLSLIVHDAGLGGPDGLLGRDILDAFTVTIDAAAGRATLTPR